MKKQIAKIKNNEKQIGMVPFEFTDAGAGVTIPGEIHLIPIGQWNHDGYGPITITAADIQEFADHFNAKIRKGVPITAGHEGFEELPAVGWIISVDARADGLWGKVEWNELGKSLLSDKAFKFFSPEFYREYEDPQSHEVTSNVLTGGALTKSPYFKELEAVVFSERQFKKKFNESQSMNIKDIIAKDITTLSEEEKAFLKEHKAELTDEQKASHTAIIDEPTGEGETAEAKTAREAKEKADADAKVAADKLAADNIAAGKNADGSDKVSGSEKVMITASELKALQAKADEGQQAFAELKKQKTDLAITGMIFSESNKAGRFLPKSKENLRAFWESLNAKQCESFSALLKEIPASEMFSEKGDNGASEGTAKAELESKIAIKMSADKSMKYSDALKAVLGENKGLEERYDKELPSKKS